MSTLDERCPRCGAAEKRYSWQVFSNGTTHIRVECDGCGVYIAYAPQTPWNCDWAGSKPKGERLTELIEAARKAAT